MLSDLGVRHVRDRVLRSQSASELRMSNELRRLGRNGILSNLTFDQRLDNGNVDADDLETHDRYPAFDAITPSWPTFRGPARSRRWRGRSSR